MLKIGINYKTPAAVRAIHNLKVSTQKRVYQLRDIISQASPDLKAKKEYMQSASFWNDPHNVKMTALYKELINWRDEIAQNIKTNNAKSNTQTQIQGTNGYARIKKFLDKNPKMNLWNKPTFQDKATNEYRFVKLRIHNLSREFKKLIGK